MFHGCHAIWGWEYRLIREWLMPPWFLVVQAFLIVSMVLCVLGRCISVLVVLRFPVTVLLRFGYQILLTISALDLLVGTLLSLTTIIFGVCCWSRDWLLYPNYNHLSWGWVAVLLSSVLHLLSSLLFLREGRLEHQKKELNEELLSQLQPPALLSPLGAGIYI